GTVGQRDGCLGKSAEGPGDYFGFSLPVERPEVGGRSLGLSRFLVRLPRLLVRSTGPIHATQVVEADGKVGVSVLVAFGRVEFAVRLQGLLVVAQRLLVRSTGLVHSAQVVEAGGEVEVSVLVGFGRVEFAVHLQGLLEVGQRLLVGSTRVVYGAQVVEAG